MPKNQLNKHCTFQNEWLDLAIHPDFFWVQKSKTSTSEVYCSICRTNVDISNMGISAVKSHAKGKKHAKRVNDEKRNKKISFNQENIQTSETTNLVDKNVYDLEVSRIMTQNEQNVTLKKFNSIESFVSKEAVMKAEALNLLAAFISVFEVHNLPLQRMIQVSMDGPNVNKKFFRDLCSYLNDSEGYPEILEIGTCVLHIVNGSYKAAHAATDWKVNEFLSSLYYLFKDFSTRRADYIYYTNKSVFPLKFCSIRWLENSKVMERAIQILDVLPKYIKGVEKNPPGSNNYNKIVNFVEDKLLKAKLSFMISISLELEPFLAKYQTDWPMLPFLRNDLFSLLKSFLSRIIKSSLVSDIKNTTEITNLDLLNKSNFLPIKSINIGFAASESINARKDLKEIDVLQFRLQCQNFILQICKSLMEKSPLRFKLVQGASCLAPEVMQLEKTAKKPVEIALSYLINKKRINAIDANRIKKEYCSLIDSQEVKNKLCTYDYKKDRLDTFLFEILTKQRASIQLEHFFKLILLLFHGNASVERSFSYNQAFLVENLHESSLIAQRSVHDAICVAGGIQNININKEMLKTFSNAYKNKKNALLERENKEKERKQARKRAAEELKELQIKKKKILETAKEEANMIDIEVDKLKKLV